MQKRDLRPFLYGGIASIAAEIGTFPIDTTKTRLQIQGQKIDKIQFHYTGMTDAFLKISRQEGFKSLYSGIGPAVCRQAVYGTIKFGTYYTLKDFIISHNVFESEAPGELIWINVGCATIAGSVSSFIANPTDVLKVRMQIHGKGTEKKGLFKCFREIYKFEGIRGLYRGSPQTAQRAAVIAAVELPVYDFCKHKLMDTFGNQITNHTISSFIASLLASVASTPFDVVRTRLMNQRRLISSDGIQTMYYKNSLDCLVQSVRNEGFLCLYKGLFPTFLRMGPWNIIFFVIFEQLNTHL